jgi:hypothetical protein
VEEELLLPTRLRGRDSLPTMAFQCGYLASGSGGGFGGVDREALLTNRLAAITTERGVID